ncbi:hypothetical protein K435DRAFT_773692 [Dendrothele bispora CBS 962.96]|uniref:Hyaluronan/mRNA-binding protein domain-containing protein n=1 Tax=Dendrothele bispora (strain CBS 962.96) TaxID=1314807 RepID=A0A4S8MRP5_DENBC|nr:hypothetical protein K435DRAFT_773692 [Dendrothele bispora CBS 962.96]
MTRTARAISPRAIIKDRSLNRSGLDRNLRKEGGGQHNWGRPEDELAALEDEQFEFEEYENELKDDDSSSNGSEGAAETKPRKVSNAGFTEEELAAAKAIRKKGFKGEVDLGAIARSSNAVSSSPPKVTSPSLASESSSSLSA